LRKDIESDNTDLSANPSNPAFDSADAIFQALQATLFGKSASTKNTDTNQQSQSSQPTIATVLQGQQLSALLKKPNARVLFLDFSSAGGNVRTLKNLWVEIFYTTPAPSFNGGAVVSYILFDPSSGKIEAARSLRKIYAYSKFKAQKMTVDDNLSATR
jgi:hypothetical protein